MIITISRSIEIDAGHRVPFHISKCKHLHGHRWKITAFLRAECVVPDDMRAADSGMVLDYGVLKSIMMEHIHDVFDHRMILWAEDPIQCFRDKIYAVTALIPNQPLDEYLEMTEEGLGTSVVVVPMIPTAENLARYWAELIDPYIRAKLAAPARLIGLEVQETPNSTATHWIE